MEGTRTGKFDYLKGEKLLAFERQISQLAQSHTIEIMLLPVGRILAHLAANLEAIEDLVSTGVCDEELCELVAAGYLEPAPDVFGEDEANRRAAYDAWEARQLARSKRNRE